IDQDARKTIKKIQNLRQYDNFLKHSNIQHIRSSIMRNSIDLKWTYMWMKFSPFDAPTSSEFSLYQSYKLKYHLNQLPTTDILNRNYPRLIEHLNCFICNKTPESNLHLWRCPIVIDHLYNAARTMAFKIINFLVNIYPKQTNCIVSYINHLELFDP